MAIRVCFVAGMLGLLLTLGSGCDKPCCSGATSGGNLAAAPGADQPKDQPGPTDAEKAPKTKQVILAVTGMTWPVGWPPRVQKALETLPWVRKVQVDFPKKQATVTAEAERYDENALLKALEKTGFGGEVVKPEKADPLGAETRVPTAEEAKTYQLGKLVGKVQGQYVTGVHKGGPAEKAGLKVGDVLLALDANKVFSRDDIDDFLQVSQPESKVKALVKRADTYKEETVSVALGATKIGDKDKHFTWQYAGLGQLDAALAAAKKDGKVVLVGLSGADTWWPTTRFESGPLSQILDDPAVLKASQKFVRLIVRRPHAYEFKNKDKSVPIPGIVFLDGQGKVVGTAEPESATQLVDKMTEVAK